MIKKALKVILVLVMILGIAFSISNFFAKKADATMIEEQLHEIGKPTDDLYIWWCQDTGQGCYTVTPEEPV
jgi:hypothetical protein